MNNGLILTKADSIRDALPISAGEFTTRLKRDSFVLWSLPQFRADELAEPTLFPADADLVESKNSDLHGTLLSAHFEAGLWPVVYQGENNDHLSRPLNSVWRPTMISSVLNS